MAQCLRNLPDDIRALAAEIPVLYEKIPSGGMRDDGIDADTLGLFIGTAFPDLHSSIMDTTPCIFLFLDNILEYSGGGMQAFTREVRLTYLHELGHYLGMSEEELGIRGLE